MPSLGPRGRLSYAGRSVLLSERDAMLAAVLVYNFERPVQEIELLDRAFPEARLVTRCASISLACNAASPVSDSRSPRSARCPAARARRRRHEQRTTLPQPSRAPERRRVGCGASSRGRRLGAERSGSPRRVRLVDDLDATELVVVHAALLPYLWLPEHVAEDEFADVRSMRRSVRALTARPSSAPDHWPWHRIHGWRTVGSACGDRTRGLDGIFVVVGRRGLSTAHELLLGSVSNVSFTAGEASARRATRHVTSTSTSCATIACVRRAAVRKPASRRCRQSTCDGTDVTTVPLRNSSRPLSKSALWLCNS